MLRVAIRAANTAPQTSLFHCPSNLHLSYIFFPPFLCFSQGSLFSMAMTYRSCFTVTWDMLPMPFLGWDETSRTQAGGGLGYTIGLPHALASRSRPEGLGTQRITPFPRVQDLTVWLLLRRAQVRGEGSEASGGREQRWSALSCAKPQPSA